jgi:Bacterial membrane protein YfhO
LLPFADLVRASIAVGRRWGLGPEPNSLATMFVPNFFNVQRADLYWGYVDFTQVHYYVPSMALALALASMLGPRAGMGRLLVAGSVVALIGATTLIGPALRLLDFVPSAVQGGFELYTLRLFTDLGLALAVGLGWDAVGVRVRDARLGRLRIWVPIVLTGLPLAAIAAYTWRWSRMATASNDAANVAALATGTEQALALWIASGLVLVALHRVDARPGLLGWAVRSAAAGLLVVPLLAYGANQRFNSANVASGHELSPSSAIGGQTGVVAFLQHQRDAAPAFRIDSVGTAGPLWATACVLWGLDNANGNNPLLPRDTRAFLTALGGRDPSATNIGEDRPFPRLLVTSPLLNLLNVRYIISTSADGADIRAVDPTAAVTAFPAVFSDVYHVYENVAALPRAFVVPNARVVAARAEQLQQLATGAVDPRSVVLLDEGASDELAPTGGPQPGSVTYRAVGANETSIDVRGTAGGYLVILDPYWPGWVARRDGQLVPILRANVLFRAIPVPAGDHQVVLSYEPVNARAGLLVTALAGLLALGILAWRPVRRLGR